MKALKFTLAVFAVLALAFSLVFCDSGSGTGKVDKDGDGDGVSDNRSSETYTATKNSVTYTLFTGPSRAKAVHLPGDVYALTAKKTAGEKDSAGTVVGFKGNVFTLQPSNKDAPTFTVTISGAKISSISGTVTFEDGSTEAGPGTFSTGGGGGGGGGGSSGTSGTGTTTTTPVVQKVISFTINAGATPINLSGTFTQSGPAQISISLPWNSSYRNAAFTSGGAATTTGTLDITARTILLNFTGSAGTQVSFADRDAALAAAQAAAVGAHGVSAVTAGAGSGVTFVASYPGNVVTGVAITGLPAGAAGSLTIPASGAATIDIAVTGNIPSTAALTLGPTGDLSSLSGRAVDVSFTAAAPRTLSLTFVHYLREALKAYTTGAVTVSAVPNLTPVFNGSEWAGVPNLMTGTPGLAGKDLYSGYANGFAIMDGITASTVSGKRALTYTRQINIDNIMWEKNDLLYPGVGVPTAFYGTGLRKGVGGSVANGTDSININGGQDGGSAVGATIDSFSDFRAELEAAGLSPKDGVFLNYVNFGGDQVNIVNIGSGGNNIATNSSGVYDFILPYGNTNRLARLPAMVASWPGSLTFDGQSTGATPTTRPTIGSQATNTNPRKAAGTGVPNEGFVGNMTASMMKYMVESMGITKIAEANIIGNASDLPGLSGTTLDLSGITTVNVGYIGDLSSLNVMDLNAKGVTDIKGPAPANIGQGTNPKTGYLNLYDDVTRATNINRFFVVRVHGTGGQYLSTDTGLVGDAVRVNQIIFNKKYTGTVPASKPSYRAFLDGSDGNAPKITGSSAEGFMNGDYASTVNNIPIYPMDESAWIAAAQAGGMAGADAAQLAGNLTALGATYKWASEAVLIANAVN